MADSNKVVVSFDAQTSKASGDVRKFKGEIEAVGPSGKKTAASISGSFKTIIYGRVWPFHIHSDSKNAQNHLKLAAFGSDPFVPLRRFRAEDLYGADFAVAASEDGHAAELVSVSLVAIL